MKSDNILYLHNGFFKYYTSSTISMILYYYLNICVKYAKNTTKKLGQQICSARKLKLEKMCVVLKKLKGLVSF